MAKNKEKETVEKDPVPQEETVPETEQPAEPAPEAEAAPADDFAAKLEALQKQNADLSDKLLRQMAEFDNYRKRTTREKEEIGVVAKSKALTEMLPVVDNFERAMQTACADPEFQKGAAEGQPFNPDLHYAVTTVEDEALGSNTVAAVLQKGYRLGDKVLRHAMVSVANP